MKKLLFVIDMQNDFIDGALGTKEAQAILPAVIEKVKTFRFLTASRERRAGNLLLPWKRSVLKKTPLSSIN